MSKTDSVAANFSVAEMSMFVFSTNGLGNIDRLWPRGVTKIKANLDEWNKEIAPSIE